MIFLFFLFVNISIFLTKIIVFFKYVEYTINNILIIKVLLIKDKGDIYEYKTINNWKLSS